jgi:hypothetical protein
MVEGWPERIQQAQASIQVSIDGTTFDRIRYGKETDDWGANDHPCQDGRVFKDEFHVPGCDGEECPRCHEQLITCDCDVEDL